MNEVQISVLFSHHARIWKEETKFLSSSSKIIENYNYRAIIALGVPVVPFIYESMKECPNFWFAALYEILGQEPRVPDESVGKIKEMTDIWVKWLENNGLTEKDPVKLLYSFWKRICCLERHVKNLIPWADTEEYEKQIKLNQEVAEAEDFLKL